MVGLVIRSCNLVSLHPGQRAPGHPVTGCPGARGTPGHGIGNIPSAPPPLSLPPPPGQPLRFHQQGRCYGWCFRVRSPDCWGAAVRRRAHPPEGGARTSIHRPIHPSRADGGSGAGAPPDRRRIHGAGGRIIRVARGPLERPQFSSAWLVAETVGEVRGLLAAEGAVVSGGPVALVAALAPTA
eukprot:scaffold1440_cov377-Prasinococcus_capsulatus_cf.AAC.6